MKNPGVTQEIRDRSRALAQNVSLIDQSSKLLHEKRNPKETYIFHHDGK